MTGKFVNHSWHVIGCSVHPFRIKGIDLGSKQEEDSEVVEEKQQDYRKTDLPFIVAHKVRYIERKEVEVDYQGNRSYNGSTPAIAKTDVLVRHDYVYGLKKDPGDEEAGNNANDGKDQPNARYLVYRRGM